MLVFIWIRPSIFFLLSRKSKASVQSQLFIQLKRLPKFSIWLSLASVTALHCYFFLCVDVRPYIQNWQMFSRPLSTIAPMIAAATSLSFMSLFSDVSQDFFACQCWLWQRLSLLHPRALCLLNTSLLCIAAPHPWRKCVMAEDSPDSEKGGESLPGRMGLATNKRSAWLKRSAQLGLC